MYSTPHDALRFVGFVLPSLDGEFPLTGSPQVRLGSLSAKEAHRLAAWIRDHG
ncbi:hypothetical protein [Streptantibioticus ferralitis]|uniref:Uncharacterized protein n=1 Tax=Streptantibioticus ferralitis TaxID=236510 RepID=A0ABT5YV66_9ACTN|nr:hypothetical protein [Streptantibioticus ferralitis]MDF2255425.1 hypothetical protein [Streptantibioticus ferralitis]